MKSVITFIITLLISTAVFAQAPQAIPYQAVARNSSGAIIASQPVGVRFTIKDSIATGAICYRETHSVTTTPQGLFTANVGGGTPVTGTFSNINWATNAKFLQVEIDPAGGSSYIDMGTQQMMSVPYALNSGSVNLRVSNTGDTLYSGTNKFVIIPGVSSANSTLTIGSSYGGGIIAYIFQPGDAGYIAGETHGLIAAASDQSTGIQWYNGSYTTTGATGSSLTLGTGMLNTNMIVSAQGSGTYAARICSDLILGGFDDWYLPNLGELIKLYTNRIVIGGFSSGVYWSSSEYNSIGAWQVNFSTGNIDNNGKSTTYRVRAVRGF